MFVKAQRQQAFGKFGFLGFQGSGKTFSAKEVAIGLHKYCVQHGSLQQVTPVYFLDTETGSDWVVKDFEEAGIELLVDKTKAFKSLVPAIQEVEKQRSILIIDSITHFWNELVESFSKKKNRRNGLQFQDWAWLKGQWRLFTDAYVNSQCHIIMCGRAGYEYDFLDNEETGKRELAKTGVKMKAETETGYEPSLLVYLSVEQELKDGKPSKIFRNARIIKDRSDTIDGKDFANLQFEHLLPHIQCLNVGGEHVGVVTTENSEDIVPPDSKDWQATQKERDAVLDEIQCHMTKLYPSSKIEDKTAKADMLEEWFGTRSWKRVQTMRAEDLGRVFKQMTATKIDDSVF